MTNEHPRPGRKCEIILFDGTIYEAEWVEKLNKYTGCRRWRRTDKGLSKKEKWIDDDQVKEWRYV